MRLKTLFLIVAGFGIYSAIVKVALSRYSGKPSKAADVGLGGVGVDVVVPRLEVHIHCLNRLALLKRLVESLARQRSCSCRVRYVIHHDYDMDEHDDWKQVRRYLGQLMTSAPFGSLHVLLERHTRGIRDTLVYGWSPSHFTYALYLNVDVSPSPSLLLQSCHFARWHVSARSSVDGRAKRVLGLNTLRSPSERIQSIPTAEDHMYFTQEPGSWGTVFCPDAYAAFQAWVSKRRASGNLEPPFVPKKWSNQLSHHLSAEVFLRRWMWERGFVTLSVTLPVSSSLTISVDSGNELKDPENILASNLFAQLKHAKLKTYDTDGAHGFPTERSKEEIAAMETVFTDNPSILDFPGMPSIQKILLKRCEQEVLNTVSAFIDSIDKAVTSYGWSCPRLAMRRLLREKGVVVPDSIDTKQLFALSRMILRPRGRKVLVAEPILGLGNRIRVLVSAIAYTRAVNGVLIVIWEPEPNCDARFSALFKVPRDVMVFSDNAWLVNLAWFKEAFVQITPLQDSSHREFNIDQEKSTKIYMKTFLSVSSKFVIHGSRRFIASEMFHDVSEEVQHELRLLNERLGVAMNHPLVATAHIREVLPGIKDLAVSHHETMLRVLPYRLACQAKYFWRRLTPLLKKDYHIIISSDNLSSLHQLLDEKYSDRFTFLNVSASCIRHRTEICIVQALATMITLAQSGSKFIGSLWSSFSEVIGYLADSPVSGCFSPKSGWTPAKLEKMVSRYKPDLLDTYKQVASMK